MRGWRSGALPKEHPAFIWTENDGPNPGISQTKGGKKTKRNNSRVFLKSSLFSPQPEVQPSLRSKSTFTSIQASLNPLRLSNEGMIISTSSDFVQQKVRSLCTKASTHRCAPGCRSPSSRLLRLVESGDVRVGRVSSSELERRRATRHN